MRVRQRFEVPLPGNRPPLILGERTLVMGIINVTPDSFADGGLRFDPSHAIEDGWRMLEDGADILDAPRSRAACSGRGAAPRAPGRGGAQ